MQKKYILLLLSFLFITILSAEEFHNTDQNLIPVSGLERGTIVLPYTDATQSSLIDYEYVVEPTTIMTSYYDYMPGGYANYPIQKQIGNGNGTYLTFHAKESPTSTRRQYWAYYDESGVFQGCGPISTYNEWQGYGDLVLHPATGKCIATWQESAGCAICYDDFSPQYTPGAWASVTIIPNPLPDEYLCPRLYTGPSPNGDGWIRIYHISQNGNSNASGYACNDLRIMYMDIENTTTADLSQILNLDNWTSVTPMTSWRDKSCCVKSLSFAANDDYYNAGKVGMMGYCEWTEGDLGNMPVNPGIFFWESSDYGATWDVANLHCHSQGQSPALYQVENKAQFEFNGFTPDYLDVDVFGFHNTGYYYSEDYAMTFLQGYTYTDPQTKDVYYLSNFKPQAEVVWDYYESEFCFYEIPVIGYDSYSGHHVPWSITQNDTILYVIVTECSDYTDLQSNAISWGEYLPRIQIWTDATYQTMAQLGYTQYNNYIEHPIINFSVSYYLTVKGLLYGQWYSLIELTDINNPIYNFSNQITVYPYVDKYINYIGCNKDHWSGWNEVYIYYYDDNSYGSYVMGLGNDDGGQLKYCVLKFRVAQFSNDIEPDISLKILSNPNPSFGKSRISFSSTKSIHTSSVKIFNAKGQLVNILESQNGTSPTEGYAVWDGTDKHGKDVINGIYFYKVDIDGFTKINKMLLAR